MKKIILLLALPFATLMAIEFIMTPGSLTPASTQSAGESGSSTGESGSITFEPTLSTSQYLEPVDIPAYNANDSTHVLITPTNGKWKGNVLNNPSYKHFYIEPGDYGATPMSLEQSGTAGGRITLSLYNPSKPNDTTHPAVLPDNKQANVKLNFTGGNYWTIDRLSDLDHPDASYLMEFLGGSSHNIINRFHARGMPYGISIRVYCDYNTVQNCYIHSATHNGRVNRDAVGVALARSGSSHGDITRGTKIINNDIRNLGDGIQLVGQMLPDNILSFPETIIDSNRIWIDNEIYTNGDWTTNGYNPNGEFMVSENAMDFKTGSLESDKPVIVTNNICWGYREQDKTTGSLGGHGTAVASSYPTQNIHFENNIIFDSTMGALLINFCSGTVKNNIIFDIGRYTPPYTGEPDGTVPEAMWTPYEPNCGSTPAMSYENNSFITIGTNQAGVGRTMRFFGATGMSIKNNLFIGTQTIYGSTSENDRDNNWYYNHTGSKLGGTNEGASDDAKMENYSFQYERFTANPKTKTLNGVISITDSPHYEKAGSSITTQNN